MTTANATAAKKPAAKKPAATGGRRQPQKADTSVKAEEQKAAPVPEAKTGNDGEVAVAATKPVGGGGSAIILPNGQRRIDYIRDEFYKKGTKRGDIARALTEMTGKTVPYQIVFAASKGPNPFEEVAKEAEVKPEVEDGAADDIVDEAGAATGE